MMTKSLSDFDYLDARELQRESARAMAIFRETNTSMAALNKQCHHDSHIFYKLVLQKYWDQFNGLPSEIGPGKDVTLILDH